MFRLPPEDLWTSEVAEPAEKTVSCLTTNVENLPIAAPRRKPGDRRFSLPHLCGAYETTDLRRLPCIRAAVPSRVPPAPR